MLDRFFKKTCPACQNKVEKLNNELRLKTSEGTHSIYVCDNCSNFFEDSAEVLKRKKNDKESI